MERGRRERTTTRGSFPLEERRDLLNHEEAQEEEEREEEEEVKSVDVASTHAWRARLASWAEKDGKPHLILLSRITW